MRGGNEIVCFFSEAFYGQGKGSRPLCNSVGHLVIPIHLPCTYLKVSLYSQVREYVGPLQVNGWMDGFTMGYWCCHRFKECWMPSLASAQALRSGRLLAPKVLLEYMTYDNHPIQPSLIPSHKASLIIWTDLGLIWVDLQMTSNDLQWPPIASNALSWVPCQ